MCAMCKTNGKNAFLCSKCKSIIYCGIQCQKNDWARHRELECIGHQSGQTYGPTTLGYVMTVGNFTMIRLLELNEDAVFQIAVSYVKENKLNWSVRKPHAWSDYQTGPHVTLSPSMKKYNGEIVQVELGSLFHFTADPSRWVAFHAVLPLKFECPYGCHISIAQQRYQ